QKVRGGSRPVGNQSAGQKSMSRHASRAPASPASFEPVEVGWSRITSDRAAPARKVHPTTRLLYAVPCAVVVKSSHNSFEEFAYSGSVDGWLASASGSGRFW